VEVVLTSPLVRARQTAEILAGALDPRPSLVNIDSLAPDGAYGAVVADLEKHARKTRLALVGHEPMIGELAARILGSRHPIEFKKGAVCRIDIEDLPPGGPGDLRWMLTPKILRALKK
jgi:phosphohistidine phosphatase